MSEPKTVLSPHDIGELVQLVNQGRPREAEARVSTLLQAFPAVGMLWKILGVALLRQGKDALQALRRTTELLPQDGEAHGNLGQALAETGEWAAALVSWRRALDLQPRHLEALIGAADALKALGRAAESIPFYERAAALDPESLEAHNNLGNAFLELGRVDAAAAAYRRAEALRPDDAQVLCNLSNALRQQGLLVDAMTACRRGLALDESLGIAHNSLGLILAAQGLREEAAASYRRALMLDPRYGEALNNLGHVLRDLGHRREAASLFARAIETDSGRAEFHCSLGDALFDLSQTEAAVECYRRALALRPNHAAAHLSLAAAYRLQRRPADAESSCGAALALNPSSVEALAFAGELRADRGQFAAAETLFQRAIGIDPGYPFAYCSIAAHRKMTRDDAAWLHGAQSLSDASLPLAQEIGLRYALGKYFDDVAEYEAAFAQYRQANELTKRYGSTYDPEKLARRVDQIMAAFDARFIRASGAGSDSPLPVFVIGMPRSGTSLTEQILASHPAVHGAGEVRFWDAAFDGWVRAGEAGADTDAAHGAAFMARTARDYLKRQTALAGAACRVVDKMPANFMYAGLIHAVFPQARIIHMRRHPIDTCLSVYFQNFFNMGPYANDLDNLASYYSHYARLTAHWRAVLPAATLLEVPYEGLVEDQETWSRRMIEFIGLPWDPQCLDFHRTDRVVITASRWQVRQQIHASSLGRWRNYEQHVGALRQLVMPTS